MIGWIARITPHAVARGIQVALGILLLVKAWDMLAAGWLVGAVALVIVLRLRSSRRAPASIVLIGLGLGMLAVQGRLHGLGLPGLSLPPMNGLQLTGEWTDLIGPVLAQIPLTITNAVIATVALITVYWPEHAAREETLSRNMGILNVVVPFFGGMPMCHGAGGLAGQYYFGARTGGAKIIEGVLEITLGLFFAAAIVKLFSLFPVPIIGAMLCLVGLELVMFVKDVDQKQDYIPLAVTVATALLTNMGWGFLAGLTTHYLLQRFR
ncbi:MAG: hypothetical protein GY868_11450 [Deltaproteobacteria bacterium]|nr:hypothetical protein [Deltaproteobacteria bacterium]